MLKKTKYFIILISFLLMNFTVNKPKIYSVNELIGKGKIELYGKDYKLQKEAYLALEKMIKEAKRQGVKISVVSSYRGFNHQNRIWKRKFNAFRSKGYSVKEAIQKVMEYTAIPGTSRHHWGTDVDISNGEPTLSNSNKTNSNKKKYLNWLNNNAHKFGFYLVYTDNKLREGYNYESWHYSYRKLAKPMLEQYIEKNCLQKLKDQDIAGSKYFTDDFIAKYVKQNIFEINNYLY